MTALLSGLWHHPDTFPPELDGEKQIEDPSQMQFPALVVGFFFGGGEKNTRKVTKMRTDDGMDHVSQEETKGGWLEPPQGL